jgi:ketosteroid isomerase-like protein
MLSNYWLERTGGAGRSARRYTSGPVKENQMTTTPQEVAEAVRAWCAAWNSRDLKAILGFEARGGGFGFRPLARRDHAALGEAAYLETLQRFFDQMVYQRVELEDLQTSAMGDVGLAWGTYIETFQEKGQPPERARVRFSKVLTRHADGWRVLLYHRDIQPFGADGRYPRSLTVVEPASADVERAP